MACYDLHQVVKIVGIVICLGIMIVLMIFIPTTIAQIDLTGNDFYDACYELDYLIDENINISACKKYLQSNPDATGQEVLDHLDGRNVDIINSPLLRDT